MSHQYNDPIIQLTTPKKDAKKLVYDEDLKTNSIVITLTGEDHTIGNLVRYSLSNDRRVEFSGYKMPHPLEDRLVIKMKLKDRIRESPIQVFEENLEKLKQQNNYMKNAFEEALKKYKKE